VNSNHIWKCGLRTVLPAEWPPEEARRDALIRFGNRWARLHLEGQCQRAESRDRKREVRPRNVWQVSALGLRFTMADKLSYEVVGIVENGKYESLTESPWTAMFFPLEQNPDSDTALVVRSRLSPGEIVPKLSQVLAQIDPSLPFTFRSWPDALGFELFPARVATASLGMMGLLAAMHAVTGVFGMAMYSVSKRIKEFGIRVALGAQPIQLMRSALSRPLILLLSGSTAGLVPGAIASQLLAQIVYQATPRDPLVLAGVMTTMTVLGSVAIYIPAQRALRIHPAGLLREE
jgi:ABC-type antimicrobial peptide transport system permease subunit